MKKEILIIILTLAISINANSQRLSTNELMNIISFNQDDLDTYLVKKGYIFKPETDSKNEDTKNDCIYFYEYTHKLKPAYNFVSYKCKYENYPLDIGVRIPNESEYLLYKKELKDKGFKFTKSFTNDGTSFLKYELIKGEFKYVANLISRFNVSKFYEVTFTRSVL